MRSRQLSATVIFAGAPSRGQHRLPGRIEATSTTVHDYPGQAAQRSHQYTASGRHIDEIATHFGLNQTLAWSIRAASSSAASGDVLNIPPQWRVSGSGMSAIADYAALYKIDDPMSWIVL
jgi:hypothetical protein